jgi:hypothetical protein
MRQQYR